MARPFLVAMLPQFEGEIGLFAPLLKDVRAAVEPLGVRDWPGAFLELGVRAVAVRMLAKSGGEARPPRRPVATSKRGSRS